MTSELPLISLIIHKKNKKNKNFAINFVDVGGVLFKVYIVGEAIKVVRRFSLPDVTKRELSKNAGVFRFPRVSCAAASADDADLDPCVGGELIFS